MGKASFSSLQSALSVLACLASLSGAVYSAVRFVRPAPGTGELLAVVRAARSDRAVPGATVEVLTRDDAVVATLSASDDGFARRPLAEGAYRVRVTAPHFATSTRDVHVEPGATAEVRVQLAEPEPSGHGGAHPVSRGVGAAQRFLQRLGL